MDAFDEREKAFEAKYHLDEEISFKVNIRRAKLLGLWIAEKLGLAGTAAQDYARELIDTDLADSAHAKMLAKARADLTSKGITLAEERIQNQMDRLFAVAHQQIVNEVAGGAQQVTAE